MARTPICPLCDQPATKQVTRFGLRFGCCGLWAWGRHPLADRETHQARRAAHDAFDPIWRRGLTSRSNAYKLLAQELGITKNECHMKLMNARLARRVPEVATIILEKLTS